MLWNVYYFKMPCDKCTPTDKYENADGEKEIIPFALFTKCIHPEDTKRRKHCCGKY